MKCVHVIGIIIILCAMIMFSSCAIINANEGSNGDVNEGSNGNTNEGSNGNTNEGSNGNANEGSNGDANEGTNGDANEGSNGNTNEGSNGDANEDSNGDANEGTNGDANEGTNGDANEGSNGNTNEGSNGGANEGSSGNANEYDNIANMTPGAVYINGELINDLTAFVGSTNARLPFIQTIQSLGMVAEIKENGTVRISYNYDVYILQSSPYMELFIQWGEEYYGCLFSSYNCQYALDDLYLDTEDFATALDLMGMPVRISIDYTNPKITIEQKDNIVNMTPGEIYINGEHKQDIPVFFDSDRVVIPLIQVFEALGLEVDRREDGLVYVINGEDTYILQRYPYIQFFKLGIGDDNFFFPPSTLSYFCQYELDDLYLDNETFANVSCLMEIILHISVDYTNSKITIEQKDDMIPGSLYIDGELKQDIPVFFDSARVVLPMLQIFESLGLEVDKRDNGLVYVKNGEDIYILHCYPKSTFFKIGEEEFDLLDLGLAGGYYHRYCRYEMGDVFLDRSTFHAMLWEMGIKFYISEDFSNLQVFFETVE